METEKSQEEGGEAGQDDVYQISSGDEDCSKGMQSISSGIHGIYLCALDFS